MTNTAHTRKVRPKMTEKHHVTRTCSGVTSLTFSDRYQTIPRRVDAPEVNHCVIRARDPRNEDDVIGDVVCHVRLFP